MVTRCSRPSRRTTRAWASNLPLDDWLAPWTSIAFRHVPAGSPYHVLDFRYAGRGLDNRWNEPGEPTLYLASDVGVVIAEFGRHFEVHRTPPLRSAAVERTVYRLEVTIGRLFDLRKPELWQVLSLREAPSYFADRDIARAVARYLRVTTAAQGFMVPSMAMLDKVDRWVMVIFLEKVPRDPGRFVTSVQIEGPLRFGKGPTD